MESITCIFCKHENGQYVLEENGYKGRQCSDCNLLYISPRPTLEEVIDLYGHSNATISAQSHITPSLFKTLHARHTLKRVKKFKNSGDLLEIGSGGGHFLFEARNQGFVPYGLELNPIQADFIRSKGVACQEKPLSSDSFDDKQFDVIYHCDVISHLHEPVKEFNTMFEKLKPGGILIFETGNIGDIKKSYYDAFTVFQYPDHLFFFTEHNLKQLLELTGFQLKKIYRYNIQASLKLLKLLYKPTKSSLSSTHTKQTSPWVKQLIKKFYHIGLYGIRYQLGTLLPKKCRPQTVIVIARKPKL